MTAERIRVLCVDDNAIVADGIRVRLAMNPTFEWVGQLASADDLISEVRRLRPDVVLLDIDMPGRDPLEALRELAATVPQARTLIVSGYERDDYLDRSVEAGAWGYVSKNDGPDQLIAAIGEVSAGRFAFGAKVPYQRGTDEGAALLAGSIASVADI